MNTIAHHISELLYDHECVVMPGFGALISRYHPAEINPATHMMRPPSKRIAFNSRISDNDGLLASHISRKERISYKDALSGIEKLVINWTKDLKEGKKVNLSGIGRFYFDSNSKIQFNPSIDINYHKESFGLSIFRGHAIQREIEINKGIHKAIEKQIPTFTKTSKKNIRPYVRWAAIITPFIALSLATGIYVQSSSGSMFDYAGFFRYENTAGVPSNTPAKISSTEKAPEQKVMETAVSPPLMPAESEDVSIDEIAAPVQTFHIIVGSFKDKTNATNYVEVLKGRGYDAYVADGDSSFRRVAIGNFGERTDAVKQLALLKKEVNPSSWIYSN